MASVLCLQHPFQLCRTAQIEDMVEMLGLDTKKLSITSSSTLIIKLNFRYFFYLFLWQEETYLIYRAEILDGHDLAEYSARQANLEASC